ncbi:hypothetical protein AGDE_12571 [Angomonas deanei]|uniref:Uncharacterized protein n=1 Tax=Angomonas deanei TaxID=59799 RepID=A0A7G2CDK1_9TRYP|nr:hypothetical protein AGDE_12571 [Angomonas deanei]CAD2217027.1 hypothetical protein, conserved [Angomonas deanei]|eukprot:EPY24163.1 hypothetical protein AGDE_12571 [Angomonas deanei]
MSKYSTVFQVISTAVFFFLSLYLYQCSSFSELMAPIEGYSLTDVKKSNLTPESYTALFWMQRSSTVSYINLYNTDEETSGFETLDSTFAEEGNVVVPFRAMYLSIFGKVLEPLNETYSVWMGYYVGKISERDESYLRRSSVVVISFSGMFACLVCWKLVHTVSELIVNCVKQRESLVAERNRLLKGFTAEQIQSTINVTSISTAFVVLFLVVVPLFVLEVTSLNPVCCSSALVGLSVIFLVRGEADIARSKEEVNEFKTDKPIVIQGKLHFFPLKKAPSLTPFCLSAVIGVVAVLLDAGQFTNVLAVLAWIVTACVRRGNRRVLVKMVSGKDGPKNVGFSFYSDTMMMLTGMCCISAVIFGVLFCCTAPFWYGKQSWPVFAALFFQEGTPRK